MNTGFHWVVPPDLISKNLDVYKARVQAAVYAAAMYWGQQCQNDARRNAPWQDRTGNARSGLYYAIDGFGLGQEIGQVPPASAALKSDFTIEQGSDDVLIIALSHSVFYGKFLELRPNTGIVMSTVLGNLPLLEKMLRDLFRD